MVRLLLALQLCCCAAAAQAQPANRRADAEARRFLPDCHEQDDERQRACLTNQRGFVEQYVYAKAGDILAMGSTAASFGPHNGERSAAQWLGMPQNLVQACAWRMVRFAHSHESLDQDAVRRICDALAAEQRRDASQRAATLMHELETSPAVLPDAG